MKHVVIAGGGFAGIRVARKLSKQKDINVTIINDRPDFRYYPAMYRSATGFKLGASRLPLEWILLDQSRADLFVDSVNGVNPETKTIKLTSGKKITYDYAVFALGSITTYFHIEGIPENSYGMKGPEEITELRDYLHKQVTGKDEADQNYVIVGAGPTGCELAGGLGTYIKYIAKKHRVRKHGVNVWLVEAGPRILPMLTEGASRAAHKRLEKHGVKILTNTTVTRETASRLSTSRGPIKTHTVIWTAGTANNPFFAEHPDLFELNKRGRVVVDKHLMTRDHLYVAGDNAATAHGGLAVIAIEHANFIAKDIIARIHGRGRPTKYESSPISVIPIDNRWAVLQYGKLSVHGWPVALIRRAADYIGYADVLGPLRAFTIWSNSEKTENNCMICDKNS